MSYRHLLKPAGSKARGPDVERRNRSWVDGKPPAWWSNIVEGEAATLEQYRPLAIKVARKYARLRHSIEAGLDQEDLFQIAWLGVLRAIRTYKADNKASFLTWAFNCAHWIVRAMLAHKRALESRRGAFPLWPTDSLDWIAVEDGEPLSALTPSEDTPYEPRSETLELACSILRGLGDDGARLAEVWRMRAEGFQLDHIGAKLAISRERVRQLQVRAGDRLMQDDRWIRACADEGWQVKSPVATEPEFI